MLEKYYIRPATIDRLYESWIASAVEQYVAWMAERRYADRSVYRRIPILVSFGEFAKTHGASGQRPTRSRRPVRASVG
jgi:integrase/recombinase XerD